MPNANEHELMDRLPHDEQRDAELTRQRALRRHRFSRLELTAQDRAEQHFEDAISDADARWTGDRNRLIPVACEGKSLGRPRFKTFRSH